MQAARHVLTLVGGFALLGAGIVMLVIPGPGWVTIALGLALLARHYSWARRALGRLKKTARIVVERAGGRTGGAGPSSGSGESGRSG